MQFLSKSYRNGLLPDDDGLTVIRITLANLIVLITSLLIIFYLGIFIKQGNNLATFTFSAFIIVGGFSLYLIKARKLKLAFHIVQLISCYMISISMITFGWKSNGHALVPMLMVFIFIFFEDEKAWLIHCMIVLASFMACFRYLDINGPIVAVRPLEYDYYVNMAFAIISCGILSFILMNSFRKYVSERQDVFKEMARSNRLLEEKNMIIAKQKDELEIFNSMASHDLKGPIRTISSFSDLLSRKQLDPQSLEYLEFIKKGSSQLSYLVEGITAYQQLNENRAKNQNIDTNEILEKIRSILNPKEEQGININFEVFPRLNMNPVHFHHIIQNLVENGLKYNSSKIKTIDISHRTDAEHFLISVQDNGIGIDKEFHEYVFEPFKKLNASNKYDSTGLGLSIVTRIISLYEGEIELISKEQEGSRFIIKLPLSILASDQSSIN